MINKIRTLFNRLAKSFRKGKNPPTNAILLSALAEADVELTKLNNALVDLKHAMQHLNTSMTKTNDSIRPGKSEHLN